MADKGNDIVQQLKMELGLDTTPATKAHSTATNKIISEVETIIDKYKALGETIKSTLTPAQIASQAKQGKYEEYGFWDADKRRYDYMGTSLRGKSLAARQREAQRIRDSAIREKSQLKGEGRDLFPELESSLKNDKFENIVNSMKMKYTEFGKVAGITSTQVNRAIIEAGLAAGKSAEEIRKMLVPGDSWLNQMGKIAERALITVPVWMALRNAIQFVTQSLEAGMKAIVSYDKELARIRNVTDDVGNIETFLGDLGKKARKMSTDTGLAVGDILHSFYGFKDAGLSSEVAMAGMQTAVKGSVALFGDLAETAKTLTDVYVVMGDKITDAVTPQQKMERIMSSIVVLQKTNKFELNEFTEGLKSFAGTAAANNLTLDQMAFLLAKTHTFMQRGSAGGTQLSNTLRFLSKNAEAAGLFLGEAIDYNSIGKFDLMMKVLDKLNKKFVEGKDIQNDIYKIFGTRAEKAMSPMVANLKNVIVEWEKFKNLSQERRMEIFSEQEKNALATIENQLNRLNKIKEQMGANALAGFFGIDLSRTKDAAEGLKLFNDKLEALIPTFQKLGAAARPILQLLTMIIAAKGITGFLGGMTKLGTTLAAGAGGVGLGAAIKGGAGALVAKGAAAGVTGATLTVGAIGTALTAALLNLYKHAFVLGPQNKASIVNSIMDEIETNKMTPERAAGLAYDIKENRKSYYGLDKKTAEQLIKVLEIIAQGKMPKRPQADGKIDVVKRQALEDEQRKEFYDYESTMLNTLQRYGYSQIDIEGQRLRIMEESTTLTDRDKQLHQQRLKILQLEIEEMNKFAATLSGSIKGGIEGILSGKGSISDLFRGFNTTVQDTFRGQMAQGMTDTIMRSGIGDMFGGMSVQLRNFFSGTKSTGLVDSIKQGFETGQDDIKTAFDYGANETYKSIVRGFKDGTSGTTSETVKEGSSKKSTFGLMDIAKTAMAVVGIGGGTGKFESATPNTGTNQVGWRTENGKQVPIYANQTANAVETKRTGMNAMKDLASGLFGENPNSNVLGIGNNGKTAGGKAATGGQMLGAGMAVAGFGMALADSYKLKGTGNVIGGAMNLGMSGAMAGMAVGGPIGAIIGGAVGVAVGAIQGGKSKTTEEWETQTHQITSKIDVTNNHLEYVNRNLVALRNEFRTFMLPRSAYFTEKSSIEDNFSISSKRGII